MDIFRFVIRMVWRTNKCLQCLSALEADLSEPVPNVYSLVSLKSNGGLIYPSASVLKICKEVEHQFTILEGGTSYLHPEKNYLHHRVTVPVVNRLIENAG